MRWSTCMTHWRHYIIIWFCETHRASGSSSCTQALLTLQVCVAVLAQWLETMHGGMPRQTGMRRSVQVWGLSLSLRAVAHIDTILLIFAALKSMASLLTTVMYLWHRDGTRQHTACYGVRCFEKCEAENGDPTAVFAVISGHNYTTGQVLRCLSFSLRACHWFHVHTRTRACTQRQKLPPCLTSAADTNNLGLFQEVRSW